jgi:signal transduction histidine kinase/CheY-like chemotaxis protein/CHASE3 domain sensor protein
MFRKVKIGTKIGAGFAAILAVVSGIGYIAYRNTNNLVSNANLQAHSYEVLGELKNLNLNLQSAEASQRAFIVTGEQRSLQPFDGAISNLDKSLVKLRRLTSDNPQQQSLLSKLELLIPQRVDIIRNRLLLRQNQGFEAARQEIISDKGREVTDQIRNLISQIEADEQKILQLRSINTQKSSKQAFNAIYIGVPFVILLLILILIYLNREISHPLQELSKQTVALADGDLSVSIRENKREDEVGMLIKAFNRMVTSLRNKTKYSEQQTWLKSNLAKFSQMLQGQRDLATVAKIILSELAPLVNAQQGVLYFKEADREPPAMILLGSYAYQQRKNLSNRYQLGESLVGQCALEKQKILLTNVPDDYIQISSGLGEAKAKNIIVLPILFESEVAAVIELASFQVFKKIHLTFLDELCETLGVVLNAIASDIRTVELLKQSQALAELLQNQQAELQESNERLAEQAKTLQASEELLQQQQQELQQSNEELQDLNNELEKKAELLELQKQEVEIKNNQLEEARQSLEIQASELELSSKYKSQFLANMSHELRTPLNSLLILAKLLSENSEGNLTTKQIEYSNTIYGAGNDLLSLINDILDLAKIESGTMSFEYYPLPLAELKQYLERTFKQTAQYRGLNFILDFAANLPSSIDTDAKRLQQVLKNLLANAFKFTEQGEVRLTVNFASHGWNVYNETLNESNSVIAFSVSDTGIGIAPEKQKIIFEAFQQADGSTNRKHGGTGLGLSISREIVRLFGGEITLSSHLGEGSTFTLYLPINSEHRNVVTSAPANNINQNSGAKVNSSFNTAVDTTHIETTNKSQIYSALTLQDDRKNIKSSERVLLIIEDDINFARILYEMAQIQGFKSVIAQNGNSGISLARQIKPSAILLDIDLPGIDGWMVLDRLKHDVNTRHIPVHVMTVEDGKQRSLQQGAIGYLQKPVTKEEISEALNKIKAFIERSLKYLLVAEDDIVQRQSITELIGAGNGDVSITDVGTAEAALAEIRSRRFDCMVLDLGLPDMDGFELLELIKKEENGESLPIIIYTGKEISKTQEVKLRRITETIIIKDVNSPERLLAEASLFLHRVQKELPINQQKMLEQSNDSILTNQKVLIVDDDVRNIFALTGLLEKHKMQVVYAENGREGIETLEKNPDINIILMDIMMPEIDGYETTRKIRQNNQFKSLPIIALTAKAMQGDREKCIEAGASDYITKPVDTEQLLSLLRVWLYN